MHNDKFNLPFIEFVNRNFNTNHHLFLIWGGHDEALFPIPQIQNVIRYNDLGIQNKTLLRIIYRLKQYRLIELYKQYRLKLLFLFSKKIYLDGLFQYHTIKCLSANSWCLKKSNWHIWGGDMHYKSLINDKTPKDYESRLHFVISRLGQITSIPDDFKLAQKKFNTNAIYTKGYYVNPIKREFLDDLLKHQEDNKEYLHVVIGNSADKTNNHIEIIDLISKYKHEKIKVFAPLSYGDKDGYANEVVSYGRNIFEDRFIPLFDYMPPKEYSEFLKSIDVALYNHKRQQALHNIHALLYLGKKVFIRTDISTWNHLKDFGIKAYSINSITNLSFAQFIENAASSENHNATIPLFNNEYLKNVWTENFIA